MPRPSLAPSSPVSPIKSRPGGRPRCDPIDYASVLAALEAGNSEASTTGQAGADPLATRLLMMQLYRAYASVAARPYARASWEGMIPTGCGLVEWGAILTFCGGCMGNMLISHRLNRIGRLREKSECPNRLNNVAG